MQKTIGSKYSSPDPTYVYPYPKSKLRTKIRSRFPGLLLIIIVSPIVPESAAANRVDNNEEDKEHNVDNRHLLPRTPEVVYESSLA